MTGDNALFTTASDSVIACRHLLDVGADKDKVNGVLKLIVTCPHMLNVSLTLTAVTSAPVLHWLKSLDHDIVRSTFKRLRLQLYMGWFVLCLLHFSDVCSGWPDFRSTKVVHTR